MLNRAAIRNWALLFAGTWVLANMLLAWSPTRSVLLPIAMTLVSRIRGIVSTLLHLDGFTYMVILGFMVLVIPFLLDLNRGTFKGASKSQTVVYLLGLIPLILLLLLVRKWFFGG